MEIKDPESWTELEGHWLGFQLNRPQLVVIWGAMPYVGSLCFLKTKINVVIYQGILENFILPFAEKLYGYADFISQQGFAPADTVKWTGIWGFSSDFTVLD